VLFLNYDVLADVVVLGALERVVFRVVVTRGVERVDDLFTDLVCSVRNTLTERVILSLFVVISHITLERLGGCNRGTSRFYSDLRRVPVVDRGVGGTVSWVGVVLGGDLVVVGGRGSTDDRTSVFAELTLR
jgi:hypothetical protein